jgi:hypothetical protein
VSTGDGETANFPPFLIPRKFGKFGKFGKFAKDLNCR